MRTAHQIANLIRWDLLREMRRKETLLNMSLLAVLILFTGHLGVETFTHHFAVELGFAPAEQGAAVQKAKDTIGPVFFWIASLFAGTVGLNHSFVNEREGTSLGGITTAPIDPGIFYLAKVAATWFYVMLMQVILFGAYVVLFNYQAGPTWSTILCAVSVFSLAYIAPGVVLAAMTTTLGGSGELILRILLFVLMIPLILLTLEVSSKLFGVAAENVPGGVLMGGNFGTLEYLLVALAFSVMYLCAGYLLFPKVLEE